MPLSGFPLFLLSGGDFTDKKFVKRVIRDTFPVMIGYLVLGAGFGIIMNASGYGVLWSVSMSVFIYAGSMQYAAISLLTGGASLIAVALTTFAVNARHFFYGISMIDKYKNTGLKKPYLIFSLTDETYSLVSTKNESTSYNFWVSVFNHFYWVAGTTAGAAIGSAVKFNTKGIDFALTALFICIFTEQWKTSKNHLPAVFGVLISVLCLCLFGADNFLIPAMIIITALLLLFKRRWQKV